MKSDHSTPRMTSTHHTRRPARMAALPITRRRAVRSRRGNALVLVAAVLLMLAIIGMAYVVRTQGMREIAAATQTRAVLDTRIDSVVDAVNEEITQSLFLRQIVPPTTANGVAGDPGLLAANNDPGVLPMARSDWPRRAALPTAARYGIDSLDYLTNLLDPGDSSTLFNVVNNGDGYPDAFNFAPFVVKPWTNWPDTFGFLYGESNPLGNPGYGDLRWLASTEPQRASVGQNGLVPDPFGTTFSHWAHLSWLATPENGFAVVPDISNILANALTGPQGTPIVVPENPTAIPFGTSLAALGIPYEQWLPGVIPAPLTSASNFIQRRNLWFTPAGYYNAVHGPFGQPPAPVPANMLPNCIQLADPFDTGVLLSNGTRPTDEGPTRWLANGQPDDSNNTIRNIIGRTLADADGDGITDSFWFLAPTSIDRGVRQLVAVRVIDNSGLLNLNVATRFQRRNLVPPAALSPLLRETRGHTPADVALWTAADGNLDTPVGFFNTPDNAQPTGFYPSSPGMTVSFFPERWDGIEESDPSFLRERGVRASDAGTPNAAGLFPEQLRLQSERLRLFKSMLSDDSVAQYFNPPAASSLPMPNLANVPFGAYSALTPFTAADEAELRLGNGSNQPFIVSRLERAINTESENYAFLRTTLGRDEQTEWMGKQLSKSEQVTNNRNRLTTISSARNEVMPPALWTRWWKYDGTGGTGGYPFKLRQITPNDVLVAYGPPSIDDLPYAYPTLAKLENDLGNADAPAYPAVSSSQIFTVGGWRPEVVRALAGDANNDGRLDARDLDVARRDFFLWNSKLDLRTPIDANRVGAQQPVVDATYGVFGEILDPQGLARGGEAGSNFDDFDEFDQAFATIEFTKDFQRRALRALKNEYRIDDDNDVSSPALRTVASYADRHQLGSDMPGELDEDEGFHTLTGTFRPRSIVADGVTGKMVDTALRSEKVTNAMVASLAANAATTRRGIGRIGPFTTSPSGASLSPWQTWQPLLPAHSTNTPADGQVPDQRVKVDDPDPTLPGSNPPGGTAVYFGGVEAHPVIMEAFFAVVWPKTRLGSNWQFAFGTNNPSVITQKPKDPYSVPPNYGLGGDESHFVAIVPQNQFVDQGSLGKWNQWAGTSWQRQSTAVVAVQVANPYPVPIKLNDFRLEVFGNVYVFPATEQDANGNNILGPDTDGDGTPDAMPLILGPCTEDGPRTAIVFAITDHNQINYRPGDSVSNPERYPLTKGVEFDPFFRARWLDYLDIVEASDLGGANSNIQSSNLAGQTPTAFCPHTTGVLGTEANQGVLTLNFPRRRLAGTSRESSVLFGSNLSANAPVAQTKILDATQELGTDVAAYRPDQGIVLKRRLRNPETGVIIGNAVVDRFDRDASDTDQTSADPVTGWNISAAATLITDPAGRFWPPPIDLGHSADEDQMNPILDVPPPPPPPPQPLHPWHLKPQQAGGFNGIRINTNDYFITWTRSSRLWAKDFGVVYGANAIPVAYDRSPANNNGKGDGLITPDERVPRFAFASAKQRPDLPRDGAATAGAVFADGQGPFKGGSASPDDFRGAAFQSHDGLTPWVQDLTYNWSSPQPYPLPPTLRNPANQNTGSPGCGDPDILGAMVAGFPLKGNHILPLVRNYTTGLLVDDNNWPPATTPAQLDVDLLRVAMKPTSFPSRVVVGLPQGETEPRQIFGLNYGVTNPAGVSSPWTFLGDKGLRPPVTNGSMETEIAMGNGENLAVALDGLHPMDGAFTLGQKRENFDTVAEVGNLMIWGPVSEAGGNTRHTLPEILTDRVPGYPVGLVHRYVDLDGDLVSFPEEQNPAWAYLNRIYVDNPSLAFSWKDMNNQPANPPEQRFLRQWGGASGAVGAHASSVPLGTRLLEAFTMDDRGTAIINGPYASAPFAADLNGDGLGSPNQLNETEQWIEDSRFRLAASYSGKGTPGLININTAPVEVLRALPHMSRLVYNDSTDVDGDLRDDVFDIDTNNDTIPDATRQPVQPAGNPLVRVPEAIDLYRSRTETTYQPDLVYPSRASRNVGAGNQSTVPHYLDRGQIPGDSNNDDYQDTGFFPGMRAERGFDSLGEAMLLTRSTAAPNGAGGAPSWGWDDNQSWSIRFAGLDPFRIMQNSGNNNDNVGGGYRQLTPNGPYQQPPYNARISTDTLRKRTMEYVTVGGNLEAREKPSFAGVAGDAREQELLLSSLSNILTTRSDVFTVYLRVRSVKPDPVTGRYDGTDPELIVDDSRYVMCIDRSRVEHPGDAPRIVYFQKVNH